MNDIMYCLVFVMVKFNISHIGGIKQDNNINEIVSDRSGYNYFDTEAVNYIAINLYKKVKDKSMDGGDSLRYQHCF